MILKPKQNHPDRSVQKSQDRKKADKFGQMLLLLLIVFFDCNDVVHNEFLPQVRTINKQCYLEVIYRLHVAIRQKLTEFWKNQSWILQHNNAPANTSMLVREFLAKNKIVITVYTGKTWLPADFFLFPKLRKPTKEKRFATIKGIKEDWKKRWYK